MNVSVGKYNEGIFHPDILSEEIFYLAELRKSRFLLILLFCNLNKYEAWLYLKSNFTIFPFLDII